MKSAVETLSPTRVKLTVEVGFDELEPSLDAAYKKIAQQVRVPGFRPGRVPPRIIDQRIGRGLVLEQAVNDALPGFYTRAVQDNELATLGQPELDVTEFADGEQLRFTAEIDVRPEFDLPEYAGMEVTVDDVDVTDEEVEQQVNGLRDRFAALTGVDRPAQHGDHVLIDLAATRDGEEMEDAQASGVSYEVGSASMIDGLDEAIDGLSAGEHKTFTTTLVGGEHAGEQVDVTVTVKSVKVKELPDLDDEFAQLASEFDTVDELRADLRERLGRVKRLQQASQARDKVLETLLERVEMPLPENVVAREVEARQESMQQQLDAMGMTREQYLESEGTSEQGFVADLQKNARQAVMSQFVLDAVAKKEQIGVSEAELSEHIVRAAAQYGVAPDQFAQQVMQAGQVPVLVGEVLRGKALAKVVESAKVTDASGREVNLAELEQAGSADDTDASVTAETAETGEAPEASEQEHAASDR